MKKPGIVWRLLFALLLVALLPLVALQQSLTGLFVDELRARISANLAAIADRKTAQINDIVNRQVDNAGLLADLPATRQAIHDASSVFETGGAGSPRYKQLRQSYLQGVSHIAEMQNFYDLLLITPQGKIVLSYKQEADLGTNLFDGPYRATRFAKVAKETLLVLGNGVSDIEWYEPSKIHTAFITTPVMDRTHVIGVLAVQISLDELQQVANDQSGLGQTGETILAQREGENARIVMKPRNDSVIDSSSLIQISTHRTLPLGHALAGEHGQGEVLDDYRQVPVLAAWRYLPRTRWGMVVKMDAAEAFAPLQQLQNKAFMLLAATLLAATAIAFWLGRSIVRPVQVLTKAAARIAGGQLRQHVEVFHDDEIGQLATAFNHMTDHLEFVQSALLAEQEHLEQKVEQRTEVFQWQEERLRTILDNVLDGVIAFTEQGLVESFNKSAERIFAYSAYEVIGNPISKLMPEVFGKNHDDYLDNYTTSGLREFIGCGREIEALRRDGTTFSLHISLSEPHFGKQPVLVATVQDISERKRTENTLRLYASVFEQSGEAILITDNEHHILAVNHAFSRLTGYDINDVRGQNPRALSSAKTAPQTFQSMRASLAEQGFWRGEVWGQRKDGTHYPVWMSISVVLDPDGVLTHYIVSFIDITERKAAEDHITHLAHHDALTGLLNRLSLKGRLEQVLATARREHRPLAVMFLDMDRFKTINDTLGHATGDELLVEVARRLGEVVRNSDIVARLGGDEFVVVLTEVENAPAVARVAEKILKSLGQTYLIGEHEVHSTPSIGLAFYPNDGNDSETLMRNADTAMYHAKSQGRNNVQFFTPEMNSFAMKRLELEHDMRVALETGQFELYYQPRMEGRTGRYVAAEALLRWHHPREGLLLPADFIRVAEETGLILPLGEWVLDEACRQLRDWRDQGLSNVSMAVNLSARQLRSPTLLTFVALTLEKHGLTGADLELEITESAVMDDPKACIGKLKALRKMGVKLFIDDFGTGYSSLSYLKLMPIQTLKIDQTFVRDIETDANDVVICTSTIALAHNLGLSVVAEGVETGFQRDFLLAHRCDFLQGFLFSEAVEAGAALAFFNERKH